MGESRIENILEATIAGEPYTDDAQSRIEELLIELKEVIEGGGGGGTSDYTQLSNKPQINGATLEGNKSSAELKLPYAEMSYIELANGKREYLSTTVPTENIPTGSVGMGFDEGVLTYKSGTKVSEGEPNPTYGKEFPFYANGQSLTDYTIYGATGGVGDRTENLFDKTATFSSGPYNNVYTISGLDTSKQYTCSTSLEKIPATSAACIYFSQSSTSITAATNGVWKNEEKTFTPNENGELYVLVRNTTASGAPAIADDVITGNITIMLNEGSTALPYEPYGKYKIPVICGGQTTNIYLDSPLGATDSIEYATAQVSIPTVDGANNLICDTTVQPSKVNLIYTGWHSDLDDINSRLAVIEQAITNV